jgi:hypothetical protein
MTLSWALPPVGLALWWPLSWAWVLTALVLYGWPRRFPALMKWALVVLVAVVSVWPAGGASGYLALALQSPSLLSAAWACGVWWCAVRQARAKPGSTSHDTNTHACCALPTAALWLLSVLGWALVIDTLNRWPLGWNLSLFAWGFQAPSLWLCVLVLVAMAWRWPGPWIWGATGVLAVFVLTRWPTGNLWDVWLDPVVWLAAQGALIRRGWRWWRG